LKFVSRWPFVYMMQSQSLLLDCQESPVAPASSLITWSDRNQQASIST
jgi:hypothetical protein